MNQVAQKLEQVFSGQGRSLVGALVCWSLSGVRWRRAEMRADFEAVGLGRAVGRDPRPEALLGDAADRCKAGLKGGLIRRLGRYEYALVEEVQEAGSVLRHAHTVTARVVPGGGAVTTERPAGAQTPSEATLALAEKLRAEYADAEVFAGTSDLSTALVTALHGTARDALLGAVSMREGTGGLYFVPSSQVPRAKALRALVEAQGGASKVTVLSLYGDAENLDAAASAASASFTAQLNVLREELLAFVEERKAKGEAATDYHGQTRVRRLVALQDRVAMWNDVLGGVAGDLTAQIEAAKAEVVKELGL